MSANKSVCAATADEVPLSEPHSVVGGGWRAWPARLTRGLLGGAIATLAASICDALWTHQAIASDARAPGLGSLVLSEWGLLVPVLLIVAVLGSGAAIIAHPKEPVSLSSMRAWLLPKNSAARLSRTLAIAIGFAGAWAWVIGCAHGARLLLSVLPEARVSGTAIAGASVLWGWLLALLGLSLFSALKKALQHRAEGLSLALNPLVCLTAGVLGTAALTAYGIRSGTTGGEGGVLGFLGVLKRPELDLRPVGLALLVGAVAYGAAHALRRLWMLAALGLALAPLLMTARVATGLDQQPKVASAIERSAPLGRTSLRLLQSLTDRDKDGASAYFGGGDCNDHNANINPMGVELPGNGIDEDCSGQDLAASGAAVASSQSKQPSVEAAKVPADLNVIFLSVDTLRGDLGFTGYPRPVTPSIDKLAAKSVVFERAYSLASYTGKSIGPMMSGKYPSETNRGWAHYNRYPEKDIMVQERLKAAGIYTIAVQSHWYFKPVNGLGRGFDVADFSAIPPGGIDATTDTSYSADRLTDSAIKVFSNPQNTGKRFFAWLHYFDPHADYIHHAGTQEFGKGIRDQYDHEVRWTDDQIGRFLDFVATQPWAKNTAIVLTSDHGEAFGEHGMIRHGFEVWEELVRVPLVVYVPGVTPKRVQERRSAIDLVPTVLELMHVQPGEPKDAFDFVSGVSLVPDVYAPAGQKLAARDVFVDMPAGPFNEERRAFIHDDMKLIVAGGVRYQLFNLASDPGEKTDLSDDKELLKKQRDLYNAFRAGLKEVLVKPEKR